MSLGQTAGCPRANRAKKFIWLAGGLSQSCPDFQRVYVFKVYVPFSCPITTPPRQKIERKQKGSFVPIFGAGEHPKEITLT